MDRDGDASSRSTVKSPITNNDDGVNNNDPQTSSAAPALSTNPTTAWSSPVLLFVYGSLMDTDIIQKVLHLASPPAPLRAATLKNYKMKMWSIYPTILPHTGSAVQGRVYPVERLEHFQRLERYETKAYTWCECEVEYDDGDVARGCRVFVWAGDPESKDLHEGSFDLERYQTYYKPFLIGQP
ncbi:hypothetical protein PRK78_007068 [Emydomyces testavorans]|uniref:Putative gamma-glutamylcyclotransferase n=1 Tax=Emydomyces testavorans TaxID=2070801 RepID=A0AAF0DMZ9_9EURO|nr:hypothetical protein PRK78_007068 [Emydomyces testavorans]